ncbi:MAG: hypothetical protein AB7H97_09240 [Pseudobdellovibrionaceae bacterium]
MRELFWSTIILVAMLVGMNRADAVPAYAKASKSKVDYCARSKDPSYFKNLLLSTENVMGFINNGGIAGGGVCWWHSRFTRAATYLAIYRPDLPRPSFAQAKRIIQTIRHRRGVVEIPGFKNLNEFSLAYADEIQDVLENWQMASGAAFGWIRGLAGSSTLSAEKMQQTILQTLRLVEVEKLITYYKMQAKGITAHAWLVTKVEKSQYANGYILQIIDSNYAYPQEVNYSYGMTQFAGRYAPYLESSEIREARELAQIAKRSCNR